MIKKTLLLGLAAVVYGIGNPALAQEKKHSEEMKQNWQHKDPEKDGIPGVAADRAYAEILAGKKSKTVLVAVIDSGIDINQEDLKDHIWVNADEIPNNGIDDDNNGYIDDINGWNFLGGKDGKIVEKENTEPTRLMNYFADKKAKKEKLTKEEKALYKEVKKTYKSEVKDKEERISDYKKKQELSKLYFPIVMEALGDERLSKVALEKLAKEGKGKVKKAAKVILKKNLVPAAAYDRGMNYFQGQLDFYLNREFNARTVVGDNPYNYGDHNYGNNNVIGNVKEEQHGTHVSGIIGADRNNTLGMRGIADNVKIMAVRAVPDGDERDKDVANAIRYAVDNGAQVVNMSFGKVFASSRKAVEEAIRYAESKGVVLVAAAGNDSENVDEVNKYPKPTAIADNKHFPNWLHVGASSISYDMALPGNFSNYGNYMVDLFSPGVQIYSTLTENNYEYFNGTSMASPVVAGCAAVLRSYYPELTANQVVSILKKSVTTFPNQPVFVPANPPKKKSQRKNWQKPTAMFETLSSTGGVVNLYKAVKLAEEVTQGKVTL